jgi:trk system potassium uptake protein TrkA
MSGQSIVIAGGGRLGRRTAAQLTERGHTITVIDREQARCDDLAEGSVGSLINGDATLPSILEQADIGEADAIAALTGDAGTNLAVCLQARERHPDVRTVARIERGEQRAYDDVVDAVVFPALAGANLAVDALVGGAVGTILGREAGLELVELTVAEDAPVADRRLADVNLPEGARVVSDADRSRLASDDMTLTPGERYVVGVENGVGDEIRRLFRG